MSKIGKLLKVVLIICIIVAIPLVIMFPFVLKGPIFSMIVIYPNSLIMLLIAIQFIKLFKSIEDDNPFTFNNSKIMRRTSIYSFLMSVFWVLDIFYLLVFKNCHYINYYVVMIFFVVLFFGVGVALYILSKLFYKATSYKEENDLTI